MTSTVQSAKTGMAARSLSYGMVLMVVAMLMLPGIDAIAKLVPNAISASQAAWARFFFQVLILAPLVLRHGNLKWDRTIWAHAAHGFLIALASLV